MRGKANCVFAEIQPFLRKTVRFDALEPFGFRKVGEAYRYSEPFLGGAFCAKIEIDRTGAVFGDVIDTDVGESYLPIRSEAGVGPFVGAVREGYEAILARIAEGCFSEKPFLFAQTNRIAGALERKYGEQPDHPFSKLPTYAAFRYPETRKWYGLVMDLNRSTVTGEPSSVSEIAEILNLKIPPEQAESLLRLPGVYPGYHMKRPDWISIVLDDSLPDDTILALLEQSRRFAMRGSKTAARAQTAEWIVPGNPKYYDVDAAFAKSDEILWKQSSDIRVGDIVYLYVGAPVSAVRYRCEAIAVRLPYPYRDGNVQMRFVMRIRRLKTYAPDVLPFSKLCALGIRAVRGPRTVTPAFSEYAKTL